MKRTNEYQTRQKKAIEEAFRTVGAEHTTVAELTSVLAARGENVGRTTVWRALERLVESGLARKYTAAQGESVCYQWVGESRCREHFHLKCNSCGKLIHMECSLMDSLARHVEEDHRFCVDPLKTVLYGLCEECRS